ncbi:hypothetical protein TNCV_1974781 [Trichonephila clavipes]|nr:hypothetical protein TNCV_1974781 [Trichonephila clavipes]
MGGSSSQNIPLGMQLLSSRTIQVIEPLTRMEETCPPYPMKPSRQLQSQESSLCDPGFSTPLLHHECVSMRHSCDISNRLAVPCFPSKLVTFKLEHPVY